MGHRGAAARPLQARQVPGRDPAAYGAAAHRLRAGAGQGGGAPTQRRAQGYGLENRDDQLRRTAGYAFYNTSRYDFRSLLADAPTLAPNLRNYLAGFSPNMREVLERFDFGNTIARLDEAGLLFLVLERFASVDLHPDAVSNHEMGSLFEELVPALPGLRGLERDCATAASVRKQMGPCVVPRTVSRGRGRGRGPRYPLCRPASSG